MILLLLILSWLPVVTDCNGAPEVMGHYEVTYYVGENVDDPACPLDVEYGQRCIRWDTYLAVTNETSVTLPVPAVGQVIAWHDDAAVAVDASGNRSDRPPVAGECGP